MPHQPGIDASATDVVISFSGVVSGSELAALNARLMLAHAGDAIYDHLALYTRNDNKTHFSVAAKDLYGGWAHGPRE